MVEQIADWIALRIVLPMAFRAVCGIVCRRVLYAVVKTVRMILREIVLLTVIFTVVCTVNMVVRRTMSEMVFGIVLRRVFPTTSNMV